MPAHKKVLFINPTLWVEGTPRYGVGMLSAVLTDKGHSVKVADYAFFNNIPSVCKIFTDFQPDVVCISMFSSAKPVWEQMIDDIRSIDKAIPIICGGPHAACAPDELIRKTKIDYIVIGEAEGIINDIIENAKREKEPVIIPRAPLPDVDSLPFPDYRTFIGYEKMHEYPLSTSRGCPYSCSYCAAGLVCSKKYRPRSIDSIMEEINLVGLRYGSIVQIGLVDDTFNTNKQRGKELLMEFINARRKGLFNYTVSIGNFRADKIDDELLSLLKELGTDIGWIGVESADEQVFTAIKKGETLSDVHKACELIRKHRMKLYLNFIIGLPGDSFEKIYTSIRFARKYKTFKIYWNLLVVYKNTAAYEWFKENGIVVEREYPPAFIDSLSGPTLNCYTTNFPSEDRLDAWRLARIVTGEAQFLPNIAVLCRLRQRYKVPIDIMLSCFIFRIIKFEQRWLSWIRLFLFSRKKFLIRLKGAIAIRTKKLGISTARN